MTDKNDGSPRYMTAPEIEEIFNRAMAAAEARTKADRESSLRDYFAGQALAGMHASLTGTANWPPKDAMDRMAEIAYAQADAMLRERGK